MRTSFYHSSVCGAYHIIFAIAKTSLAQPHRLPARATSLSPSLAATLFGWIFLFLFAVAIATVAVAATGLTVWATDAFLTVFLGAVNIPSRKSQNQKNHGDGDCGFHFAFAAFSALTLRSVRTQRSVRIAAMTSTAVRQGKKPTPSDLVVISVPIWYTRNATV